MRVFVAGATGVVGKALVPLLITRGHHVVGTTRSASKRSVLSNMGAEPAIMNGLDRDSVLNAVRVARPDVIVHQMTAIPPVVNLRNFDRDFAETNRLRTEGTAHLIAAAQEVGVRRIVAQSFTGWPNARDGKRVQNEDDALDPRPPRTLRQTLAAIRELERMVPSASAVEGVVLRYGAFYGPGTALTRNGELFEMIRRRRLPIVGSGAGVWSFIHMTDVAHATALAVEGGPGGIYNIVDDEPAEVATWLPELARLLRAKPPRHVPAWLARPMIGEAGVSMMTRIRGSSNAKAKQVLKWSPTFASWRDRFRHECRV